MSGASGGVSGVFDCQKRLRLSRKVDECEPLATGSFRLFDDLSTLPVSGIPFKAEAYPRSR